jgi:hypothetical protein
MVIFLLSFLIVGLAMLGLAVGVLAGRRPIKGGCGGNADCPDCAGGGRRAP